LDFNVGGLFFRNIKKISDKNTELFYCYISDVEMELIAKQPVYFYLTKKFSENLCYNLSLLGIQYSGIRTLEKWIGDLTVRQRCKPYG
jgi:hypothetical protein